MSDIAELEKSLDNDKSNNDGKLEPAELQLLDDFLNGSVVNQYDGQDPSNIDKRQQKQDNKNYERFGDYMKSENAMQTMGNVLLSQISAETNVDNLPYYQNIVDALGAYARDNSTNTALQDYLLGSVSDEKPKEDGQEEPQEEKQEEPQKKPAGLIAQMTEAITSTSKKLQEKQVNSESSESNEHTNGGDYYKDLSDLLSNPDAFKKFDVPKLDSWIVKSIELQDETAKLAFIDGYKAYLQSQIEDLKADKEGKRKDRQQQVEALQQKISALDTNTMSKLLENLSGFLLGPSVTELLGTTGLTADQMTKDPQWQKTLNTAFHFDKNEYGKLIDAYDGNTTQVQESVLAYIKLMNQGMEMPGLDTVQSKDIVLGSALNKEVGSAKFDDDKFYITKPGADGSVLYYALETNADNTTSLQEVDVDGENKLSVYFGDAQTGNALNLQNILASDDKGLQWVISQNPAISSLFKQDTSGEVQVATGSKESAGKTMNTYGSLSEAFTAFFSSGLFRQIQKMLYSLGALSEKGLSNESRLALDFLNTQDNLDKLITTSDPEVSAALAECGLSGDSTSIQKTIAAEISSYKRSETTSGKSTTSNYLGGPKDYFCNYLSPADQIRFLYNKPLQGVNQAPYKEQLNTSRAEGKKPDEQKTSVTTDASVDTPEKTKNFKSGESIADLKIKEGDEKISGITKLHNEDPNSPYLTIDGQVVMLTLGANGEMIASIFVEKSTGQVQEKTITLSGENGSQMINIEDKGGLFDVSQANATEKVFKGNTLQYPEGGITDEQLPMWNYFAWSPLNAPVKTLYDAIASITEPTVTLKLEKALADAQRKIEVLTPQSARTEDAIKAIITEAKTAMTTGINGLTEKTIPTKPAVEVSIKNWAAMFGVVQAAPAA